MTLPTRAAVRKLADDIDAGRVDAPRAIDDALDAANADGALALMVAAAVAKRAPTTEQCSRVLPMLDEIEAVPLAIVATAGDRAPMLLEVVERDQLGQSRDALLLFYAHALAESASPKLGALLRRQARRSDSPETAAMLLATARATRDVDLVASVCSVLPYIDLPLADQVGERWKKELARPLLDALAEDAGPRVVASGFTARRAAAKVGRNDPCPCGSGKKYKKCHEGKDLEVAEGPLAPDPIAERLRDAASSITPDQVSELRPQDLARLDLASLSGQSLVRAFRRIVVLRDWKLVDRALAELGKRKDLGALDVYRDEIVYEALFAGDVKRARAVAASFDDPESMSIACKTGLDLIDPAGALPRLEERVVAALRDEDRDPSPLLSIADALLTHAPGVGIVFTRGAINPMRDGDSQALLDGVEEARDELALAPGDPAGAIYSAMIDVDVAKRAKKELAAAKAKQRSNASKAGAALRKKAREAAARVEELEAQLVAQQAALTKAEPKAGAATPADDEERRRLRAKIDELKGHIAEGNKERGELRKELAQRDASAERDAGDDREERDERDEDDEPESDEGIAVDARVRGVAVPRFAKAAAESLREVPARIARDALVAVADLAAGDAAAWREVKQLEKAQTPIFSARIGIHYRMLFRTDAAGLEVLELFHRKNLESIVKRYA